MDSAAFLPIMVAFLDPECDRDHEIEMRWYLKVDGNTKWHTLFNEDSMARYGLFPDYAEYRLKDSYVKRHQTSG